MTELYKFKKFGFCPCCLEPTLFISKQFPLQDHFKCSTCDSLPLERDLHRVVDQKYTNLRQSKILSIGSHSSTLRRKSLDCTALDDITFENLNSDDCLYEIIVFETLFNLAINPSLAIEEMVRVCRHGGNIFFGVHVNTANENAGQNTVLPEGSDKNLEDLLHLWCQDLSCSYEIFDGEHFVNGETENTYKIVVLHKNTIEAKMQEPERLEVLYVDISDSCNLACATCIRSGIAKKSNNVMELSLFKKIVDKVVKFQITNTIGCYNWSEPFLRNNLFEYLQYVKLSSLQTIISTNLSLPVIPNLHRALTFLDIMHVSLSGFSQNIHKINHRGSQIEVVKNNLKIISEIKKNKLTNCNVVVKFLKFSYNSHEVNEFRMFVEDLDFDFLVIEASGNPEMGKFGECNSFYNDSFFKNMNNKCININAKDKNSCYFITQNLPLNYLGDVYLCCTLAHFDSLKIGNFLDDDFSTLQQRRLHHHFCGLEVK